VKPPYGNLTAYHLDTGEIVWQIPLGDTPGIRDHPRLRHLDLPPLGVAGAPGGVATEGGLVFLTGGGHELLAIASETGEVVWSAPLDAMGYSNPMVYRSGDGRPYVVVATGAGRRARLQAFHLPTTPTPVPDRRSP
jgi:quinoprotein glucose dehydrogenase